MRECFVLVGGQSRRFGEDKATFLIEGKRCIEHITDRLKGVCDRFVVVGKEQRKFEFLKDVEFIHDTLQDQGALIGIHTALKNAKSDRALVVAVDTPLLNPQVVDYIFRGFEEPITVFLVRGRLYPLLGIYSKRVLPELEAYLSEGKRRVIEFLDRVGYRYIKEDEIISLDPELCSFINMNTKEDLEIIIKYLWARKG
ncbi:MAG: molybdenum cofactor guanylyltransferase MobA [Aquificaceae bacterium]